MYSLEPQSSFTWGHDGNAGAGATLLAWRQNLEDFKQLLRERPYSGVGSHLWLHISIFEAWRKWTVVCGLIPWLGHKLFGEAGFWGSSSDGFKGQPESTYESATSRPCSKEEEPVWDAVGGKGPAPASAPSPRQELLETYLFPTFDCSVIFCLNNGFCG